ncbi:glycosyltransferase [Aliivibrio fischeri]|uniref:glycosyltransferase n=1 Tax=Aliivibrio fischeri TaxID=668 RepID=UPI0007C43FF0|nr:glycosyltransferase [Aliivibrio fischeri]
MNVKVIVSTMNGEFNPEFYPQGDYSVIIINQGTKLTLDSNDNMTVVNTETRGLSISRNIGLSYCSSGDICILTDNDVCFYSGFDTEIKNSFLSTKSDIITFKVNDINNEPFKKKYYNKTFHHNEMSIMKVSSIEIALRIDDSIIFFDERFGLGGNIPIGEENIFLSDNLKEKKKITYIPKIICKHVDDIHTGTVFNLKTFQYRWLVFKRIYGFWKALIIYIAFNLKNVKKFF